MTGCGFLVFLHLVSVALGVGFSTSNFINTRLALAEGAEFAKGLALQRRTIARFGDGVIALLWITGLLLVWMRWPSLPDGAFHVKLLAVLLLTVMHGYARALGERMRRENNPALLPRISLLIGGVALFAVIAVFCAVWAFRG